MGMKNKPTTETTKKTIPSPEVRAARKQRIFLDKTRDKHWAESRRLRANLIGIARKIATQQASIGTHSPTENLTTENNVNVIAILSDLQRKIEQLTHEIQDIDLVIQVIKNTYR